jgi:hypothetical protein
MTLRTTGPDLLTRVRPFIIFTVTMLAACVAGASLQIYRAVTINQKITKFLNLPQSANDQFGILLAAAFSVCLFYCWRQANKSDRESEAQTNAFDSSSKRLSLKRMSSMTSSSSTLSATSQDQHYGIESPDSYRAPIDSASPSVPIQMVILDASSSIPVYDERNTAAPLDAGSSTSNSESSRSLHSRRQTIAAESEEGLRDVDVGVDSVVVAVNSMDLRNADFSINQV